MKKNLYFVFIAASFALLISAPGRIAYGLPLIVELNLLSIGATAFNSLAKKINLGALEEILSLSFIIFATVLYKQFLTLFSPVLSLTLSFSIFLPAASAFLLGGVFSNQQNALASNAALTAKFSAFAFLFFALRDILGYGTISLPAPNGIKEAVLFDSYSTSFLSFFASVPGAFLIFALCASLLLTAQTRLNVLEKSGALDEND